MTDDLLPPFATAWAQKEASGFRYGKNELAQVRLGYDMALEQLAVHVTVGDPVVEFRPRAFAQALTIVSTHGGSLTSTDRGVLTCAADYLLQPTWRCFHCNELFEDRDAARLHFGNHEEITPECIERASLTLTEVLAISRKARDERDEAWKRCREAEEGAEIAHIKAEGPRRDALLQVREVQINNRDLQKQLDFLRELDPIVWRTIWDKFVGGEPFPVKGGAA